MLDAADVDTAQVVGISMGGLIAQEIALSAPERVVYSGLTGAAALLVDVAGPVRFVVEGDDLVALADGFTLTDLGGRHGWVRTDAG